MFEALEDRGASHVDAIIESDRIIRAAQAEQLEQIAELLRVRQQDLAGFRGDAALSVIGELSLARHISPGAAATQLSVAINAARLPSVLGALREGLISEPTVRAICREVSPLALDDYPIFDAEIAPHLDGLTPRRAAELARRIVISLDAEAAAERAERARADQRVEIHNEPDGVATVMVSGPAEQTHAAHESLYRWALGVKSGGDERTVGQIMFARFVELVTGRTHADNADVEVGILIDLATLLGTTDNPVELAGYGPIAPAVADEIVATSHKRFYRRLITDPIDNTLLARDPKRRFYDGPLAGHIRSRDRHRCRQPGCDCRIRDVDHIQAYVDGGPTTETNGQGLCRRSHVIKHLPGWRVTTDPDGTITWRTPTGHTYVSKVPAIAA